MKAVERIPQFYSVVTDLLGVSGKIIIANRNSTVTASITWGTL